MKPAMARLTLARKIAVITLTVFCWVCATPPETASAANSANAARYLNVRVCVLPPFGFHLRKNRNQVDASRP